MTDNELLGLFKTDPDRAMRAAIAQYGGLVYRIVYSKLGALCQREDIEETVSDIFLLLYKSKDKLDPDKGSVKAYLSATAKHAAVRRRGQLMRQAVTEPLDSMENELHENEGMPFEQREHIARCILRLGKPDSDIITLKYFYGMKSKEIAKRLGIKTNTVDKKVSRALEKLAAMLEEETI